MRVWHAVAVFGAFTVAFNLYLYFRYGNLPDYASFIDYQKIFYRYGYAMLPMKLFGPWNLVIGVYLAGILYSIAAMTGRNGESSLQGTTVFHLSILGTGLFAYYQGRSHDLNLAMACYPAVIILTIFAGILSADVNSSNRRFGKIAFCGLMTFFLFCSASLIKNVPAMAADTAVRLRLAINGDVTPTVSRAAFVRQYTRKGAEVLILSSLSGVYYMVSGTTCPVKVPGPTELFLKEDYSKIFEYINSDRCTYLIYDIKYIHSNPYKEDVAKTVEENFDIAGASADGALFFLVKRPRPSGA
ncbi:hypothetical protein [Geobacter sp. OR-1]|uniref:hypothetical protein n=1 Tax=Geobacter sp. OR-1 TaxID=1266765 RepID=UPI000A75BE57|nr:hypothetical protein [Geobacter sp. OR-1]